MDNDSRQKDIEQYACRLMELARDTITVRFRFFSTALAGLKTEQKKGLRGFATDGSRIIYDPEYLLMVYMDEPNIAVRLYLHILLHCIFFHSYQYDKLFGKYWDYATDIAVENIILELDMPEASLARDGEAEERLRLLKRWVPELTAEKLYREFMINNPSMEMENEYSRLFALDLHGHWSKNDEKKSGAVITKEQWKQISERIRTELRTFSKRHTGTESLEINMDEATREHYNYREILERFAVQGEELMVNDDEFDYIYYTYGLMNYGNMPLIEPLEYRDTKKIKEFVIVIDTSASCRGDMVKGFLRRTYDILKNSESFFNKINVHIIQCDFEVRSDIKLNDERDFDKLFRNFKLKGFGATDFRPPFEYVDELIRTGELENIRGLIYFTDGYGIYPDKMPLYDVIFAFAGEDVNRQPVPAWAMKVVLEDEPDEYKAG